MILGHWEKIGVLIILAIFWVLWVHKYFNSPNTPSRHPLDTARHPPDTPRHPPDNPPRHSSGTLQMTSTAILDFVSLYVFITPNTPYRHPRDTPRHPRPPLYTACTPSRHPPDALYSHRWCPNKITQCTLGCFILRWFWNFDNSIHFLAVVDHD